MAAATSGQKTAEFSSFFPALAKSVGPIYISGKPTQTRVVALTPLPLRKTCSEEFSFSFFSFSKKKKLWNETSSLKREVEGKKALNGERTDEEAEKRKMREREEEKISLEGNYLGYFWKTAFPSSSRDGGNREGLFGSWLEEVEGGETEGGG